MRSTASFVSRRDAQGFTLLEAIVALVVFTMGAFALYGWLSTNVITLDRIRQRQQIESATLSALDLIRRSNPMERGSGRHEIDGLTVTWSGRLVEPARTGSAQTGGRTMFVVGLYDIDVQVLRDGQVQRSFRVRQTGWKQTYTADDL